MDDAALADREHASYIDSIGLVARYRPEGIARSAGGVALIASGIPMRLFNQVFLEDESPDPAELARAVDEMRAGGHRFMVSLRSGTDDRWTDVLRDQGLIELEDHRTPGMALHPIPVAAPDPPELEIRTLRDPEALSDHLRVAVQGFGMSESLLRSVIDDRMLDEPVARFYAGYVEGRPVTCGLGVRTGSTIGVFNIATIETARGRGYGGAITRRIGRDGAAMGCDVAALQASEMGRPVYERIGYRTVVEYRVFVVPESVGPA